MRTGVANSVLIGLIFGLGSLIATPTAVAAAGAATHGDAHEHAIDYDKAPLPGSVPGLGTLFAVSLVLFVGFVFVARSFVWTPLIGALDERESRISQAYAAARAASDGAANLLAQQEARMAEVHEQVQEIVTRARKEAEQEKLRLIAEAEAQARTLREQAIADIEHARESALADLNQSLDEYVSQATTQVVGQAIG